MNILLQQKLSNGEKLDWIAKNNALANNNGGSADVVAALLVVISHQVVRTGVGSANT